MIIIAIFNSVLSLTYSVSKYSIIATLSQNSVIAEMDDLVLGHFLLFN